MEKKFFEGIITKAVGGLYTVVSPDGVFVSNARGIFRKNKISPSAGDNVRICIEDNSAVICEIKERKNYIIRPPIANLDIALIVTSTVDPAPNCFITDKLIAIFENQGIEPVIILTKNDINEAEDFSAIYRNIGYKVFLVDNNTGSGVSDIKEYIKNKKSALIGNSGAGKSSLMNNIFPDKSFDTADISKKLGRGKHTTRQAEFFELDCGGYVADTPGFSTVEVSRYGFIPKQEIMYCFREFEEYIGKCKFLDCIHGKETGCLVTEAVNNGKISASRYDSYMKMVEEADKLNEWEFKNK